MDLIYVFWAVMIAAALWDFRDICREREEEEERLSKKMRKK